NDPLVERLVNLRAVIGQNAVSYCDPRISQFHNPFAGVTRIYVNRPNNHVSDSRLKYRICARSSASFCGARFQSNVKRSARRHSPGEIAEAFNFSVIAAGPSMVSSSLAQLAVDATRTNRGIR